MRKGIVISGTQSGSGKTTVNALLLTALRAREKAVQAFKAGPDYIDTAFSTHFSGRPAYNLDAWLMGNQGMDELAKEKTKESLGVVEGVMGLIDGIRPDSNDGSTLSLANLLDWPVLLVVPSARQGRTLRAALAGYLLEAGPKRVQGLILNKVSGDAHANYLKRCLADFPVPVVGALPSREELNWPERHLGLRASQEFAFADWREVAELGERFLDIDGILEIAGKENDRFETSLENDYDTWLSGLSMSRSTKGSRSENRGEGPIESVKTCPSLKFGSGKRIGLARDKAFHFYYQENLEILENWGFELVPFSPLDDTTLPEQLDGLLIGGGFPEIYADRLSRNYEMLESIKQFVNCGGACYAECGGFMYLCENLVLRDGSIHKMVGLVPGSSVMTERLSHFGYSECVGNNFSEAFRAHEFHYSVWDLEAEQANLWSVRKPSRNTERTEGYGKANLHASYLHLYFPRAEALFRKLFATQHRESK